MPSHIFTRMGYWDESIQSNLASAAAAHTYNAGGDELHAMDYLMYAYLQTGQDRKAAALLAALPNLKAQDPAAFAGYFARAAMPVRYALERSAWAEAVRLETPPNIFPGGRYAWTEATFTFARGLGAARTGQLPAARAAAAQLETAYRTLLENNETYWAGQVDIQRGIVTAWLAHAEGKSDEALKVLRAAAEAEDLAGKHPVTPGPVRPARELLGEMLLEVKRPTEALAEFETVLQGSPGRFHALYGAGHAARLAGNNAAASDYYTKLVELCREADSSRAELTTARSFLAKNPKAQALRK